MDERKLKEPYDRAEMNPATDIKRAGVWGDLITIIIGATLTIIYVGYYFGTGAHTDYLPWIHHLADPTVLARDWTIASPAYHYNMLMLMARLSKVISLPLAFLIVHSLSACLFVGAIFLLSQALFRSRLVFYLTLFLLLHWGLDSSGTEAVGGNALFSFQFAPHVVAVPFCLLAFYFLIRAQYPWAGVFAGLAANIHFLLGGITMLVIGAYLLFHATAVGWRALVVTFLGFGVVAAVTLIPVIREQLSLDTAALPPHTFTNILGRFRAPHHYLPTTWPAASYARFLTFMLFALAAFEYKPEPALHRRVCFIGGAILFLCLIGTLFVEVIPIDLVTKLQFFRMLIFIKLFVMLYIAHYFKRILEEGDGLECGLVLAMLVADHYLLVGALAGLLLAWHYRKRRLLSGALWVGSGLLIGALILGAFRRMPALNLGAYRMEVFLISFLIVAVLYRAYGWRTAQPGRRAGWIVVLLMATLLGKDVVDAWYHNGVSAYFRYGLQATSPWEQMGLWVRDHMPKDALFITPPYIGGFRVYAERAIVADFATSPLWEHDLPEWKRRLEDLSGGPLDCSGFESCGEAFTRGYMGLTEENIRSLAAKYNADYFVSEKRDDLPFEIIYANEEFAIYKLR